MRIWAFAFAFGHLLLPLVIWDKRNSKGVIYVLLFAERAKFYLLNKVNGYGHLRFIDCHLSKEKCQKKNAAKEDLFC
jgi:hypothetical protein